MYFLLHRLVLKSLFVLSVLLLNACSTKEVIDEPVGPAEFEWVRVDYITSGSAWLSADIKGNLANVEEVGFSWGTNPKPDISDHFFSQEAQAGIFGSRIENLNEGVLYYARPYYRVLNTYFYGEQQEFRTVAGVNDIEGNAYEVVQIGTQLWLSQSLRSTVYNNGDSLTAGTEMGNYTGLEQPALYFYYKDNPAMAEEYGLLYTWYAITDSRGICPAGFRVPGNTEWETLTNHLDPLSLSFDQLVPDNNSLSVVVGGMLKDTGNLEAGTGLWEYPNRGATNVSSMQVLPTGLRDPSGAFDGMGYNAAFWSGSEKNEAQAHMVYMHFFNEGLFSNVFNKKTGYALRCMKEADL